MLSGSGICSSSLAVTSSIRAVRPSICSSIMRSRNAWWVVKLPTSATDPFYLLGQRVRRVSVLCHRRFLFAI